MSHAAEPSFCVWPLLDLSYIFVSLVFCFSFCISESELGFLRLGRVEP